MSKGVTRVSTDRASGLIVGPGSANVFVEGKKVSLDGDRVADHGSNKHNAPTMKGSISTISVNGKKPIVQSDVATCGHTASGSSTVFFGNNNSIPSSAAPAPPVAAEGYEELDNRLAANLLLTAPRPSQLNGFSGSIPTPPQVSSVPGQEIPQTSDVIPNAVPPPGVVGKGGEELIKAMNRARVTDECMRAQIYAQTAHESGNFTSRTENLNYRAARLRQVWPSRFPPADANEYGGNPEKIANCVYSNRMGNGDESSGDGWKYRGRGFIQLTGKANYIAASRALGYDLVNNPDEAANDPYSADLAVWYCTRFRTLRNPCDVRSSTRTINGGENGLADRQSKFEQYRNDPTVIKYDPNNT